MTVTQRLYEAARPVWEACHSHPFVKGIGDGTLEVDDDYTKLDTTDWSNLTLTVI